MPGRLGRPAYGEPRPEFSSAGRALDPLYPGAMSTVDQRHPVGEPDGLVEHEADPSAYDMSLRPYGVGLVVLGALGLAAAFTLTVDKVRILADPSFTPSCDLNPIVSCGSVMLSEQAEVFGFPNPLLGLIGFAAVVTLGAVMALGTTLPRLVHVALALGSLAGLLLVHWLAYQTLYEIGALCPWCLVVWVVTIPTAVWSTLVAAGAGTSRAPGVVERLWNVRFLLVLAWYLVLGGAILERFWDFWVTLL